MASFGGPPSTQPDLLKSNSLLQFQYICKTSEVTYILIAIFILNIVVILYIIKEEYINNSLGLNQHYTNILAVLYYILMIHNYIFQFYLDKAILIIKKIL